MHSLQHADLYAWTTSHPPSISRYWKLSLSSFAITEPLSEATAVASAHFSELLPPVSAVVDHDLLHHGADICLISSDCHSCLIRAIVYCSNILETEEATAQN